MPAARPRHPVAVAAGGCRARAAGVLGNFGHSDQGACGSSGARHAKGPYALYRLAYVFTSKHMILCPQLTPHMSILQNCEVRLGTTTTPLPPAPPPYSSADSRRVGGDTRLLQQAAREKCSVKFATALQSATGPSSPATSPFLYQPVGHPLAWHTPAGMTRKALHVIPAGGICV